MIRKLIIVHGVTVHRAVGMDVADEMRFRRVLLEDSIASSWWSSCVAVSPASDVVMNEVSNVKATAAAIITTATHRRIRDRAAAFFPRRLVISKRPTTCNLRRKLQSRQRGLSRRLLGGKTSVFRQWDRH
jgi:hypothetical protein